MHEQRHGAERAPWSAARAHSGLAKLRGEPNEPSPSAIATWVGSSRESTHRQSKPPCNTNQRRYENKRRLPLARGARDPSVFMVTTS